MKRKLLLFIASLLVLGSINAQENYWSMNSNDYAYARPFIGKAMIDGVIQSSSDIEVAAFVGDQVRAVRRLVEIAPTVLPGEYFVWFNIKYNDSGEAVTFKIYDHAIGKEYDNYTATVSGNPVSIVTGMDNPGSASVPVMLDFITPTSSFTMGITGYGNGKGKWYLIASPIEEDVTPSADNGFLTDAYDLYMFDQTGDQEGKEWINYKPNNGSFDLVNGLGYLYASSTNTTLAFTGTPVEGPTYEISLVKDDDADFPGWNLVGNPFADTAYITKSFYVMNEGGTEIISASSVGIAPMQGVFVIATENDESLTFNIANPNAKSSMASLNLSDSRGVIDRAIIRFGEGQTMPKFQLNPNSTKLYIPMDNQDFAVVRSEGIGEIPVNFKAEQNGSYTLSFSGENTEFGYLHLIDNMTGTDVDLLVNPNYTFEAKTTDYESRFRLVFATDDAADSDSFVFYSNGNWIISNEGNATLQVIDVTGRIVKSETINGCANINVDAASGVYMLRLVNGENVKIQKVLVR